MNTPDTTDDVKKTLEESTKQIETAYSIWGENIKRYRNNVKFVMGYQWDDRSGSYRRRKSETRLTFNKLHAYIKTIMGEQLQNTPDVEVRAGSADIPQDEVSLTEGILRGISYDSNMAQQTYNVFFNQLSGGYGAYRIATEYEDEMSFNQVLKVYTEKDPTLCYWDHNTNQNDPLKIMGKYCGRFVVMKKEEFKEEYPKIVAPQGFTVQSYEPRITRMLGQEEEIVIAEHWKREYKKVTVVQLSDGETMEESKLDGYLEKLKQEHLQQVYVASLNGTALPPEPEMPRVINKKRAKVSKIRYYKLIKNHVLEEKDWPSKFLPIPYVEGESFLNDGRTEIISFCEFAKDPQKFLNYLVSNAAQQIKNMRREQWIGEPESVAGKGINEMWRNPEEQSGILLAKRDSQGQLPEKVPPSQLSPDLMAYQQKATGDIQDILGRHDASEGAPGNEKSGLAILTRTLQDNMGSYLQLNNLCNAIVGINLILLDMIPNLYDTERDVATRDNKNNLVVQTINKFNGLQMGDDGMYDADKAYYENQITRKKFRVELSAGPMFAAQKQIEFNKLMQLYQLPPSPYVNASIDILVDMIDLPNTNQLRNRYRTFVPPNILQATGELTPEEQQQMMQQQAMAAQQPPNPMVQIEMQKVANEQQANQIKSQQLEQQAQKDRVDQYLEGMRTQAEIAQIDQSHQSNLMDLQKDIIKANTELRATAMNTLHKIISTQHKAAGARDAFRGNNVNPR